MTNPNFDNRTLFHGDNLGFLRGMNSETVDLIATDPPFNKNRDFHATPDSLARGARFVDRWRWDEDVHPEWVDQIADDWPSVHSVIHSARIASGDDMAAFLCWLGVRLFEMRRVLKPTGSLYLHTDHTAHAWTKVLMDGIFGRQNFRNEIVWAYTGPSNTKRWFPRKHDSILFYVKDTRQAFFNTEDIRVPYHDETLARRGRVEGEQSIISASVENTGRRTSTQVEAGFGRGKVPEDWWADITSLTNQVEMVGYPTQKPLALYERIIKASSKEGDIVLDPFAGCATTPIAAERLRRQWVGMDIWDGAYDIVRQRMEDNRQLLADPDPQIHYVTIPPKRTDEITQSVPNLKLKVQVPVAAWQKLTNAEIRAVLEKAQGQFGGLVICGGCGRELESPFMEIDHINPRSQGGANDIKNRILLCGPCNRRKSDGYTLIGLTRANNREGWTHNRNQAKLARDSARIQGEEISHMDAIQIKELRDSL